MAAPAVYIRSASRFFFENASSSTNAVLLLYHTCAAMAQCDLCTRVLLDSERAPYVTALLLNESQAALCRSCRVRADSKPARALHIVNELVTPEVPYETWKEFAELVYVVQDEYCACLATAVEMALEEHRTSVILGSMCLLHGAPIELPHLRVHGPRIIMHLTKENGLFWCQMVAYLVYTRAIRAAAMYNDILAFIADGDAPPLDSNTDRLITVMQHEVRHTFSGAMPFSIYTLCSGFVSTLLVKNFTFYDNSDLTAFTDAQFRSLLLSLCMALHPRLGKRSPLHLLQDDVLQHICALLPASQLVKHIVFHTQEQWLVA